MLYGGIRRFEEILKSERRNRNLDLGPILLGVAYESKGLGPFLIWLVFDGRGDFLSLSCYFLKIKIKNFSLSTLLFS